MRYWTIDITAANTPSATKPMPIQNETAVDRPGHRHAGLEAHVLQEQAETLDHEAERHQRQAGAVPRQQSAFGSEQDAGVVEIRHAAIVPRAAKDCAACALTSAAAASHRSQRSFKAAHSSRAPRPAAAAAGVFACSSDSRAVGRMHRDRGADGACGVEHRHRDRDQPGDELLAIGRVACVARSPSHSARSALARGDACCAVMRGSAQLSISSASRCASGIVRQEQLAARRAVQRHVRADVERQAQRPARLDAVEVEHAARRRAS